MAKTIIEEFVAKLGWEVDDSELEQFDKAVEDIGKTLKWASGIIAGASAAIGALVVTTNRETAEMSNLASSVGLSSETLEAMTGIVQNIGLQSDNVVDLVEELSNKFGEMKGLGEMTAVEESLKILNLRFTDLKNLKPEEQFQQIIDAALKLEDTQQAVAAVDMLMGGEANKILGFLREQGSTLEEMLEKYRAINFLNEEGREGAKKFTLVWGQFMSVLQSIMKLFSGFVGDAVTPMVNEFIDFVAANKELIQSKVKEWAFAFVSVLKTLIGLLKEAWRTISPLIERLGGLKNVIKLLGIAFASVKIAKFLAAFKAIAALGKFKALLGALASPATILAGLLVILGLLIEDLVVYFQGGESALGKFAVKVADFIDNSILPFVEALTGISKEEFHMAFVDVVEGAVKLFSETLPNAINYAGESLSQFFTDLTNENLTFEERFKVVWEGLKSFLSTWFEALKSFYSALFPDLTAKIKEFVGLIEGAVKRVFEIINLENLSFSEKFKTLWSELGSFLTKWFDETVKSITNIADKARGIISKIPVIGSFFDSSSPTVQTPLAGGAMGPSPGVVNNTANQASNTRVDVQNKINVTQLPGENSEQFARRVTELMNKEVARAVRNNDTGVVY